MRKLILLIGIVLCFISVIHCAKGNPKDTSLYDAQKSTVLLLAKDNFDKQVTKHRAKLVSIVHYYKHDDDGSKTLSFEYEKFSADMQGVFKIGAVDCYKEWELCDKEKITKTPTVRIYPPLPVPAFDFEGENSAKGISQASGKFVGNKVIEINSTNINKFIQDTPSVPKCLLFTDKPGFPLIYKALSIAFDQKIFLGIIRKEEADLFERYGVKKTPQILLVKPTEKKTIPYKGEIKYGPIFDFLNVYTETFVPGGEKLDSDKPWSRETLPELTSKSSNDICFSHDGGFCAIYLSEAAPDQSKISVIEEILKDNKENNFKYMWLNVSTQKKFAGIFGVEKYPQFVIYSHGKRKKFLVHEGEYTAKSIRETLDRINNGDARFNTVKGDIPNLE
jgi:thioredoxin-like negative regulator of GroEL